MKKDPENWTCETWKV